MQFRNLINITLYHAFFGENDGFEFSMSLPISSSRMARNSGLFLKPNGGQLNIYGSENFDPEGWENAGSLWLHLYFLDISALNYTGINYQKDKEVLYADFSPESNLDDYRFEVKNTLIKLRDLCYTHGLDECEPDKLILHDGSVWEDTLASFLVQVHTDRFEEGFIELVGGAAEGKYLHIHVEGSSYPDAIFSIKPACFQAAAALSDSLEYLLTIPNREVFWCYYIIQNSDDLQTYLKIEPVKINEQDTIPLPEFEEPIMVKFRDDKDALKFVTKLPFGLKKRYPFSLKIVDQISQNYNLELPYPGVANLSSIERNGKVELCSESYIYL